MNYQKKSQSQKNAKKKSQKHAKKGTTAVFLQLLCRLRCIATAAAQNSAVPDDAFFGIFSWPIIRPVFFLVLHPIKDLVFFGVHNGRRITKKKAITGWQKRRDYNGMDYQKKSQSQKNAKKKSQKKAKKGITAVFPHVLCRL